jgi:N,N-dimethylformamidase
MSAEPPVTGYLDRFSHRPGETFTAHVSLTRDEAFDVRLVRVLSGDPNPDGPGLRLQDLSHIHAARHPGTHQPTCLGSHGVAPGPARDKLAACTWTILLWTAAERPLRAVFAEGPGLVLRAGTHGADATIGPITLHLPHRLRPRAWHRLWLAADPASGRILLATHRLDDNAVFTTEAQGAPTIASGPALFAAEDPASPTNHFTGKLEAPAILAGFLESPSAIAAARPIAAWDFSHDISGTSLIDTGPQARHGHTVNMPTRAVVGAFWTGAEHCWRHAPADYAAIHFHDDDLDDCRWSPSFSWTVPETLPSGAYALELSTPHGRDLLPLYILPKKSGPHARLAFLASTFTYQAYANHARGNSDEAYRARVAAWGAASLLPDDIHAYGHSTYNRHADTTGVAFSSRRRPILTMRPGFLTFDDSHGSGLRHYPADTHLLAWLEAKGLAYDIITDEDLDDEGPALLRPYACVLTGSHPEYHTPNTLDALFTYTRNGGRLCYLGGNGFYWRIARAPARPHLIELRRAEGGIRAWAAEPGEYHHQTDGAMGGLWRRNRRPPQALAGVGFSGQGRFEGTHYRRTPASHHPDYAWLFAGIDTEILGDYGLSGGGAAGFELDRADPVLGTPENAVILAVSENPPASFVTVPEELLSHLSTVTGEPPDDLKRGEIVHFTLPGGGEVFAVGSITFCGSLWRRGFDGPVSQLLENVVRRFVATK